ncbi:hypothetical protein SSX86_031063 [Deinandra increscens subsp. villosa]|uniref:Beta-amylase n=1 Tax=Deinandra increscens subsp. villosa TaxID=3103831 RepID=A0AAP0C749_9ASTR
MSGARSLFEYRTHVPDYIDTDERDFSDTPHVPVYVVLPPGVINIECELVDDERLLSQLKTLKSVNVDGVSVDIWWGIVEANKPQKYKWRGYKKLFRMLLALDLKIQVFMSFHEFRGDDDEDVEIPLPKWIKEIGKENRDIYFRDIHGKQNLECLTWGIDDQPVLRGRTALQVYTDFMRSFRSKFDKFFQSGGITDIQIGLGAFGELRYPANHGRSEYPSGIQAAKENGDLSWSKPPDNAGSCSREITRDDFGSKYGGGGFLEKWCSKYLIDHANKLLSMAQSVFEEAGYLSVKVSGMHWWVKPNSSPADAGFGDGYAPLISMLREYHASLNFTFGELRTLALQEIFHPEMLVSEILNAAWDDCVEVAGENTLPCYDREGYNKILELAKPRNLRFKHRSFTALTYNRLNEALLEQHNLKEFQLFVKRMHGEEAAMENWIEFDS